MTLEATRQSVQPSDLYNRDAEERVLGFLMREPEKLASAPGLTPEHFSPGTHASVYSAIREATTTRDDLSVPAIANRAGVLVHEVAVIGGNASLSERDFLQNLHLVEKRWERRRLLWALDKALDELNDQTRPIEDVLGNLDARTSVVRSTTAAEASSSWKPVDFEASLQDGGAAETPTILSRSDGQPLFYAGRCNLLIGESESGKSWLCAAAIAQELQAGRRALWIDFEDNAASAVRRLKALGVGDEQRAEGFTYIHPEVGFDPRARAVLEPLLEQRTPSVAVLDGVTEAMALQQLNPNDGDQVATFYAGLPRLLANAGAAVIMTDHPVKNVESRGRFPAGSQHKISGVDGSALRIDRKAPFAPGSCGHSIITISKDRHGGLRAACPGDFVGVFALDSTRPDRVEWTLDPNGTNSKASRLKAQMDKVLEVLREAGRPLSKNQLENKLGGSRDNVRAAVDELIKLGSVTATPGSSNSTLIALAQQPLDGNTPD